MDLKKLREDLNLSQAHVAKILGVHINTYTTWERSCGKPSQKNLEKLKNLFGIK
jgi:DNA-binding transcriptional regulator YiaG